MNKMSVSKLYLTDNIRILNELYNNNGINFEIHNGIVKIIEFQEFLSNNNPDLKTKLIEKYGATFNKINGWHIREKNLLKLKIKQIKIQPSRTFAQLKKGLFNFMNKIEEIKLLESIRSLLKKFPTFFISPASKYHHHDYKHGLLEHIVQTIEHAMYYYHKYSSMSFLNKDLIISGSTLHDFSKFNCYELKDDYIYITDVNLLQGHILNTTKIVSQGVKSDILDDIIHIIGSHHRLRDWGSPISPVKPEAWIVYLADDASSKIG